MMTSKLLKSNEAPSKLEQRVEHTLSKVNAAYAYVLDLVMVNRKCMLMFAAIIFATLPVLFKSLSSELTPTEDKGAFIAVGSAPSNVNIDYVQNAMTPYQEILTNTPEVQFAMTISGVPSSNQSLNVVTLKDWKERSKSQTAIMNELNEKAKSIPEVSVQGFAFPEIDTGEQGPPIGFVISTSQDYGDLANVAGKFLEDMQKSSKFVYTNLDLKFDTAQMRIKIDREKAGTYGITMQQISRTLGSFLSAATIERVDIDGRAYKIISQVKRDNRLSPESFNKYYITAAMVPLFH